jgi:hypothetical protein
MMDAFGNSGNDVFKQDKISGSYSNNLIEIISLLLFPFTDMSRQSANLGESASKVRNQPKLRRVMSLREI